MLRDQSKTDDNIISLKNQSKADSRKPLPDGKKEVMPFDYDMLPDELQPFIKDVSKRLQCPPDFIAVSVLCSLAALLGNQAVIKPKLNDDWLIYPTLWGMIIAPPSAKKSPALRQAMMPIIEIERGLSKVHKEDLKNYSIDKELWQIKKSNASKDAQKAISDGREEQAQQHLQDITESEPQEPKPRRLLVNDVTVAKLGEILQENPKGLLYYRDELGNFLSQLSREDQSEARGFLLECYNGNGTFSFDRISRGTVTIENCTLSMIGGAQPSALMPVIRSTVKGTRDDGLLQRFQLAIYPKLEKSKYTDFKPDHDALKFYKSISNTFQSFNFFTEDGKPRIFTFSKTAQNIFADWCNVLYSYVNDSEKNGSLVSHIQKMERTIPIIALVFELIATKGQTSTISENSLAKSCEWFEYLKSHAEAIYSLAINGEVDNAKRIIKNRSQLGETFTARDIVRKGWSGLTCSEDAEGALDLLAEHGYIGAMPSANAVGRKTSIYYFLGA